MQFFLFFWIFLKIPHFKNLIFLSASFDFKGFGEIWCLKSQEFFDFYHLIPISTRIHSSASNEKEMVCLWEAVRFSRLSSNFLSTVVENSPFLPVIKHTASYSYRSGEVEPEAAATSK